MKSRAEQQADAVGLGDQHRESIARAERRERIAVAAMQGLLARSNFSLMEEIAAQQAVRAADALIKELSK